jgi:hypothetical protein
LALAISLRDTRKGAEMDTAPIVTAMVVPSSNTLSPLAIFVLDEIPVLDTTPVIALPR